MLARRPWTLHVVAAAAVIGFIWILMHQSQRVPFLSSTRSGAGNGRAELSLLDHINNSTLGFGQIFVVGMPARTDRRDGMTLGAALSDIAIDFIDSTDGTAVPDKAIPTMGDDRERLANPVIGSWRGHVDALREVVRRNLSSALIMEDDVDWDIRIRQQLRNFAHSSRALTQPIMNWDGTPGQVADITYAKSQEGKREGRQREFLFMKTPSVVEPLVSPYGDDWDVFWLGHCGQMFPREDDKMVPKGRVVQSGDETAAQKKYLSSVLHFEYAEQYEDHTRVVHHVQDGVCSLAYAVSQRGARAMLYEIGTKDLTAAFDLLLHWACSGEFGRGYHRCLTVQPPLMQHHRPAGLRSKNSDISGHGEGVNEKARTEEIRWSVRMNVEALLQGSKNYVDQYPDV